MYCISERFLKTKDFSKMAKRRKWPTQKRLSEQSQEGQEEVDFSGTSQAYWRVSHHKRVFPQWEVATTNNDQPTTPTNQRPTDDQPMTNDERPLPHARWLPAVHREHSPGCCPLLPHTRTLLAAAPMLLLLHTAACTPLPPMLPSPLPPPPLLVPRPLIACSLRCLCHLSIF